jgi:competence protein ComEC
VVRGGVRTEMRVLAATVVGVLLAACGGQADLAPPPPAAGAAVADEAAADLPGASDESETSDESVGHVLAGDRPEGELAVHFLDVGQADATLLVHDEGAVLIDTGDWQRSDVVGHLEALGVDRLDLVIVTHPHADHIGQFDRVLAAVDVDEVWWSGSLTTTQTFERAVAALEASDAAYEEPRAGDSTWLGPLLVEVVNPPVGASLSDLHDASLALRITFGEVAFLFTGDSEGPTEQRMVADHADTLRADVLQVGHHGSRTSTTAGFLEAVDPSVAIYSASAGNQYGHPHVEVLQRLEAAGVDLYGTDVHGSVVVRTDGRGWEVSTSTGASIVAAGPRDAAEGSGSATSGQDAAATSEGCGPGQVDINSAGLDELQQIIHIGPDRVQELSRLRPFTSVRSMERIPGIGPARLNDIIEQGVACAG